MCDNKATISIVAKEIKNGGLDIRQHLANVSDLGDHYTFTVKNLTKRDLDRRNFTIGVGSVILYDGKTYVCTDYTTKQSGKKQYPQITAMLAEPSDKPVEYEKNYAKKSA